MGLFDRFRMAGGQELEVRPQPSSSDTISIDEVLQKYDLVDVVNEPFDRGQYIIAAERPTGAPRPRRSATGTITGDNGTSDLSEIGSASPSPWTSNFRVEYNAELRGIAGLRRFDQMRRGDGTVRGTLRLAKTPVLSARWYIEPASDSTRDQNVANFVWNNLTKWMTIGWSQVLTEALLMMDFGYYPFEKVFTDQHNFTEAQGKVIWQKFAPRHPMDVMAWEYDRHGGPAGVIMQPQPWDDPQGVPIPIDKLLVFSFDREGGDMNGISVLRSAYKHWYYKDNLYKIDAIQKERHSIGVPIITLPPNFSPQDRTLADELGRNLRTNERAHVVLPPNWTILYADLRTTLVDPLESAKHHDKQIEKNILAAFMDGGAKDEDQVMFLKATRFVADIVCEVFNKHAIPQLVDYNWSRVGYPQLKARRIGEQADWRTMSFAVRNLIGSGVLLPDDKLEENMREEMDLPKADVATRRLVPTPQAPEDPSMTAPGQVGTNPGDANTVPGIPVSNRPRPPRVGAPRQTPATSMGKGQAGPGNNARVGLDRSGGV